MTCCRWRRLTFTASPERVELSGAAQQAIANLDQAIREASAEIIVADLPAIRGSEIHLVTLFQNLLSNAIKYRSEAPPRIRISADQAGPVWIVRVSDNGVGIAPEYRDHVFGLFKRLDSRDVPGTGVGLAICKKIVEGLGGKIWVESEPGNGGTFCFTAPVSIC
jgi:light-regulated signal transduction histidine kinase (bacteriophytochrome)